jgi:hypothetical protein
MSEKDMEKLQEADEILVKIERKEAELSDLAVRVEMTKEDAKAAKARYDAAVNDLRALCRLRSESHPLFDEPPEPPKNLRDLVQIQVIDGPHEGQTVPVWSVQQDGVSVLIGGQVVPLTIGQYECDEEPYRLITGARDAGAVDSVQGWEAFLAEHYRPEQATETDTKAWREYTLSYLGLSGTLQNKLEEAGIDTLGKLSDKMANGNDWWAGIKQVGTAAADQVADCFTEFWTAHPEFCGPVEE